MQGTVDNVGGDAVALARPDRLFVVNVQDRPVHLTAAYLSVDATPPQNTNATSGGPPHHK